MIRGSFARDPRVIHGSFVLDSLFIREYSVNDSWVEETCTASHFPFAPPPFLTFQCMSPLASPRFRLSQTRTGMPQIWLRMSMAIEEREEPKMCVVKRVKEVQFRARGSTMLHSQENRG